MKNNSPKTFRQTIAMLLCAAMLMPMFPVTGSATEPVETGNEILSVVTSDTSTEEATEIPIDAPTEAGSEDSIEIEETVTVEVKAVNAMSAIAITDEISVPAYSGGTTSKTIEYDCGNGITNDGSKSYLTIVTGTNSAEFVSYKSVLVEAGYELVEGSEKEITSNYPGDPNRFASYISADGKHKLYTYHLPYYGETRIIVDTQEDTVSGYDYKAGETVTTPKMVMWGLSTSSSGYHIDTSVEGANTGRENNGVLIVIRMKDNSLFFYDGGILAQMSDEESAELLAFCRELTGTKVGEKMVINTWFVSHAHDDHFQAFGRFININHAHFDLKNVVYNIDLERGDVTDLGGTGTTPASKNLREALDVVTKWYPDVNYYKPHTGETFTVAGIEFDVMYTHEDRLVPDSSGNLSFETDVLGAANSLGKQVDIYDVGGTYRDELYMRSNGAYLTYNGQKRSDFNDTSTVLRVNFENKVNSILYADLNLAESIVNAIYPATDLKTDIMMIPHHGFEAHAGLVTAAGAKIYLYPQNKAAIYGSDGNYTTNDSDDRDGLRNNFVTMKNAMDSASGTEGTDYKIFWGGNETVTIDINALGQELGYTASTRVAASNVGSYVSEPANSFEYTGWTMTTAASAETVSGVSTPTDMLAAEKAVAVDVSSPSIEFIRAPEPFKQEGRYLLMSDAYGHIMSFDSTATPEVASGEQHGTSYTYSITLDENGDSENTYYFKEGEDTVILDNSDRHFAIWNLRQYKEATGGNLKTNGSNLAASGNTTFGGTAQYAGVELQKRTSYHNSYWYNHYFDESVVANQDFQLRHFCFKSDSTAFKNHYRNSLQTTNNDVYGDQSGSRVKFILDSLGDNTYLLYFKESETDYRVVTCDAAGKWDVVRYQGSNAVVNMQADYAKLKLRLYEYKETDAHKSVAFCGYQEYHVSKGTAVASILNDISSGITVFDPDHKNQHIPYDGSEVTTTNIGGTQYAVTQKTGYYWLDGSGVDTGTPGEYPVLIMYRNDDGSDTTIGQVSVIVGANYATISNKSGTVMKNSGVSTVVSEVIGEESTPVTFTLNGETIRVTVGMLTTAAGERVDTSTPGTYSGLTLTYQDMVICEDFTLTVESSNEFLDYPEYDDPGSVKVDKGTTTTEEEFSGTGVANIELSATAKPVEKGVDLIFIVDLSSSMRYHVNNSEYACGPKYNTDGSLNQNKAQEDGTDNLNYAYSDEYWKNTRMYAMEEALREMVVTLSGASENGDVRIAMADFGDLDNYEFEDAVLDSTIGTPTGSKPYWDANLDDTGTLEFEMSNHVNFVLGRDDVSAGGISQPYWLDQPKHNEDYYQNYGGNTRTYTGKLLPKIYTGSGKLNSEAFEDVDTILADMDSIIEQMRVMNGKRLGTNYDIGLETAYRLAYAREQANIAAGEDREIICIFMSDGAAMQYNYLSGRSQTEAWSQCIIGETDEILDAQNNADKYVITSDPYDTSVNQNPYLQAMLKDLLQILKDGNLIIPGTTTTYPKWNENDYNGTDFFLAMKSIGVECDWELLWQIAYKLYTHHSTRTVALADGTIIQRDGQNATGEKLLEAITMSMRKPSYDASGNQYEYQTLSPYYYFYNADGENWWAEAMKGDSTELYPVISKFAFKDSTEWGEDVDFYYGDVRNQFSGTNTENLALDGKDYIAGFRGLDMDLYTVGFSLGTENQISYEEAAKVLDNIASGPAYHYEAISGEALTECLQAIASTISTSATRAWFTDTMGDDYDLSTEKTVVNDEGKTITVNATPTIRVLEYNLEKVTGENGEVTYVRTGTPNVREVITFEDLDGDGDTDAWSNRVHNSSTSASGEETRTYPDIWDETTNVITGQYVRYNANKYVDENNTGEVRLTLDNSGLTYPLPAESFFWIIGMIGETEMVLEYQVYLEGSIEGELPYAKTYYDTNEEAILHYVNYLGNDCTLDTVPPAFPWGEPAPQPDTVVIDYGLPVNIDVLANDGFAVTNNAIQASVVGVAENGTIPENGTAAEPSADVYKDSQAGSHGTMMLLQNATNCVKYTVSSMEMPSEDVFVYAAKDEISDRYYYSTVTVIPATTIYFEDDFVSFSVWNESDYTRNTVEGKQWKDSVPNAGTSNQAQDRPGQLDSNDANNIYGFDGAYTDMATYSMGSSKVVTVDKDTFAEAQFTFQGTGFDVVSLTSNITGTILVDVYKTDDFKLESGDNYSATKVESYMVDTYYGYQYVDGEWVVDKNAEDTLYQVPVMKVSGLTYGNYTVVITAAYKESLDHQNKGSYDFYLDAIRIYDPANDGAQSDTVKDAYVKDGEGWPEYFELRNLIISRNDFYNLGSETGSGIVFIDNTKDTNKNTTYTIADYTNYGPNNELYLAPGQAVAFNLNVSGSSADCEVAGIHLAMKTVGGTAKVSVYDASKSKDDSVTPTTIETATDLYYDITDLNGKTVVITNTGESTDAILSITNVKVTYTDEHVDDIEEGYFTVNQRSVKIALAFLTATPEENVPEETVPDATEPEAPETFEPETLKVKLSSLSAKVGSRVIVTVTTGDDVESITINGAAVTKYTTNRRTGERTWRVSIKAETAGTMTIRVSASNADGLESQAVTRIVAVSARTETNSWLGSVLNGLVSHLLGKLR